MAAVQPNRYPRRKRTADVKKGVDQNGRNQATRPLPVMAGDQPEDAGEQNDNEGDRPEL